MAIERIAIEITSNTREIDNQLSTIDNRLKTLANKRYKLNLQADKLDKAKKHIVDIELELKKLAAKKAVLKTDADTTTARKKIAQVNADMDRLRAKKAAIKVQVEANKNATKDLKALDQEVTRLNNRRARLQVEAANVNQTAQSLENLRNRAQALNNTHAKIDVSANVGRIGDQLDGIANKMLNISKVAVVAGGAIAGGLIAKSLKSFGDFEQVMNQVQSVSKTSDVEMKKLSATVKQLGADSVFSATEVSQASLELAKGGLSAAQLQAGVLKNTIDLAAASGLGMEESATAMSNAMNTFGLKAEDTTKVVNAFAGGANSSSANVGDLTQALAQVGSGAVNAGLDINETVGALAAFSDSGVRGSDAGTSLKTMLANLVPQTKDASKAMKQYGLSFSDSNGKMDDMRTISEKLKKTLGGLSEAERITALNRLFGSDASRAASILMRNGADGIDKYINATKDLTAAQRVADARMKGWNGTLEKAKGSFETLLITMGEKLAPAFTPLVNLFGNLSDKLGKFFTDNDKEINKYIGDITTKIASFAKKVENFDWKGFFGGLKDGFDTFKTVAKAIGGPIATILKGLTKLAGGGDFATGLGRLIPIFLGVAVGAKGLALAFKSISKFSDLKIPGLGGGAAGAADAAGDAAGAAGGFNLNFDVGKMLKQAKNLALVYGVIKLVEEAAQALKDVNDKVPDNLASLQPKFAAMAEAITGMGLFVNAASRMPTGKAIKGIAIITGLAIDIEKVAQALKDVNDKVPNNLKGLQPKFAAMAEAMAGMGAFVGAIGRIPLSTAATGIAAIVGIAFDIKEVAQALKDVNDKVPGDLKSLQPKFLAMAEVITGMSIFVGVIGALVSTGVGALIAGAGVATIVAMGYGLSQIAEAIQDINEKVPDNFGDIKKKIQVIKEALKAIVPASLSETFSVLKDAVGLIDTAVLAGTLYLYAKIADDLKRIATVEIPQVDLKDKIQKLKDAVRSVAPVSISDAFNVVKDSIGFVDTGALAGTLFFYTKMADDLKKIATVEIPQIDLSGKIKLIKDAVRSLAPVSLSEAFNVVKDYIGLVDTAILTGTLILYNRIGSDLKKLSEIEINPVDLSAKIQTIEAALKEIAPNSLLVGFDVVKNFVGLIDTAILAQTLKIYVSMGTTLSAIEKIKINTDLITTNITSMKTILASLSDESGILDSIKKLIGLKIGEEAATTASTYIQTLISVANKLVQLQSIAVDAGAAIAKIQAIQSVFDALIGEGGFFSKFAGFFSGDGFDVELVDQADTYVFNLVRLGKRLQSLTTITLDGVKEKIIQLNSIVDYLVSSSIKESLDYALVDKADTYVYHFLLLERKVQSLASVTINSALILANVNAIKTILTNIGTLSAGTNNLDVIAAIITKFKGVITTLTGITVQFAPIGTSYAQQLLNGFNSVNAPTKMATSIAKLVTTLQAKAPLLGAVGAKYAEQLKTSFSKSILTLSNSVNGAISKVAALSTRFNSIGIAYGTRLSNGFTTAIANMSRVVSRQVSSIQRTLNSLKAPKLTAVVSSKMPNGFSKGGKVEYHATGGKAGVFKPRGTDTVPAMLTPGEFVQRKKAVDVFGVDFMQKVNALDIKGAFSALTSRFSFQHMLTPSVSTVINNVNNSTTNANRVTMHNSGVNASSVIKRVSRYLQ